MDSTSSAPAIVAVVVTCDPGPWLESVLASVARQDYPNLSVLVIDAGSETDPLPRVAAMLPDAFVQRLSRRVGFGRAANEALKAVEGASHFLLCHDDVVLAPDAVRLLVEEAYRSNAGIVGPKLLQWEFSDRLVSVGEGVDRTGAIHSLVEPGELDQGQHDSVREVFMVASGATLVRADLFAEIGGFDPSVPQFGEDLDLCWRARVAGARVIVAPAARVRHMEAIRSGEREGWGGEEAQTYARRLTEEHRVSTVVACSSTLRLFWLFPTMLVFILGEALTLAFQHRSDEARLVAGALFAVLRRPGRLWSAHRRVQGGRRVGDGEVTRTQSRGNARLRAWLRARMEAGLELALEPTGPVDMPLEPEDDWIPAPQAAVRTSRRRSDARVERKPGRRLTVFAWLGVIAFLAVGTRGLIEARLPDVGSLPVTAGGVSEFWRAWWSTWQPGGLGSINPSSPALGVLGILGVLLFGAKGTLQHVVTLGPLLLGPLGAWRAAKWWRSPRARVVALVAYALVPVAANSVALGDWPGLLVYGAAPWVLSMVGQLSGDPPFSPTTWRAGRGKLVGLALVVGVVSAFVPSFLVVVVVVGLALLAGSLLCARGTSGVRCLQACVISAIGAIVLLAPWSLSVLGSRASLLGVAGGPAARHGLGDVLSFHLGPVGDPLGWLLLLGAALPLVIGGSWRLEWAARLWVVALACFGWTWAGLAGWVPAPDPEVTLAPAAAALTGAVALGVVAFQLDLPSYRLGWRQLASLVATLAVALGALPTLAAAGSGRWDLPTGGTSAVVAFLPTTQTGHYRVLWVGAPSALPASSQPYEDGFGYSTSTDGTPDVTYTWLPAHQASSDQLGQDLKLAQGGLTTELGHLLAPLSVRYIVIPNHDAPQGDGAHAVPTPTTLLTGLTRQTDLLLVSADPNYTVYENAQWAPAVAVLPPRAAPALSATGTSGERTIESTDLSASMPVLNTGRLGSSSGSLGGAASVYLAAPYSSHWTLSAGGTHVAAQTAFGWAMQFVVPAGSDEATLSVSSDAGLRAFQLLTTVLWLVAGTWVAWEHHRRKRSGSADQLVRPEWFLPLAGRSPRRRRTRGSSSTDAPEEDEVWVGS